MITLEEEVKFNQPEEYRKLKAKYGLSRPLELLEKIMDAIVDPILEVLL